MQLVVLRFVAGFRARHGFSPTVREIRDEFGLKSNNTIAGHLDALERKKLITRVDAQARTTVITKAGSEWLAQEGA